MRFGIGMNTDHTLEEVGQQFNVTRERIRQIEAKALRKLKHPSRISEAAVASWTTEVDALREAVMEVAVDVTFLRMASAPAEAGPALPPAARVVRLNHCSAQFYRYLYDTVGAPWLWWMRRTMELGELQHAIAPPRVSIRCALCRRRAGRLLRAGAAPAGEHEPQLFRAGALGDRQGRGPACLPPRHRRGLGGERRGEMTVNTCRRPSQARWQLIAAGFTPLRARSGNLASAAAPRPQGSRARCS